MHTLHRAIAIHAAAGSRDIRPTSTKSSISPSAIISAAKSAIRAATAIIAAPTGAARSDIATADTATTKGDIATIAAIRGAALDTDVFPGVYNRANRDASATIHAVVTAARKKVIGIATRNRDVAVNRAVCAGVAKRAIRTATSKRDILTGTVRRAIRATPASISIDLNYHPI